MELAIERTAPSPKEEGGIEVWPFRAGTGRSPRSRR